MNCSNGRNCAIYNDAYPTLGNADFYDKYNRYTYKMSVSANSGNRCGVFSYSSNQILSSRRLVLSIQEGPSDDGYTHVEPIYEMISPSITVRSPSHMILSWWSNISDFSSFEQNCHVTNPAKSIDYYKYSSSYIRRVTQDEVETGDIQATGNEPRILCHGYLKFDYLMQKNSSSNDSYPVLYPIVRQIYVASVFANQGYIVDFECGDGSGGKKIHNHTSNEECGFAAAVYMPSAFIRPFNWR